jgi:phosphotransferase system  glucose/maltose/N-acetylglucosamine-specific IIC component
MTFNWEAILWYALLVDSIGACILGTFFMSWYEKKLPLVHKIFPLSAGWCLVYLLVVIWIGRLLYKLEVLPW